MQREAKNCKYVCFGALCTQLCALRAQDLLKNLTNCPLLNATSNDFYALTLKNAREARNREKSHFSRLRSRLCVLRAHDLLENLTDCPLLIATRYDFYASTLKNVRGNQNSQNCAF